MADTQSIELHFQDGFSGEKVEVRVGGRLTERFTAKTRVQVGLAHIARLEVAPGEDVSVTVGTETVTVPTVRGVTDYALRLTEKRLVAEPSKDRLNYL